MSDNGKPTRTTLDRNPTRPVLWTPPPWEVRYYEEDSAEFDDGIGAWVANHRRKEFIADVIAPKNAPLIAAAPEMYTVLQEVGSALQRHDLHADTGEALHHVREVLFRIGSGR